MTNFEDPRNFIPAGLLDFDLSRLGGGIAVDPRVVSKWPGVLKAVPEDFIVTEPVPFYPGKPESQIEAERRSPSAVRYLTVGIESDMPGLRTDGELHVPGPSGARQPAVAFTVVKKGENTWRVVDQITQHLAQQLGRPIHHSQIQTSGLKDRWAITAQTVVVVGVSMAEMRRVDWSRFNNGRRGFFIKDIRPTDRTLRIGDHLSNHFEIKVRFDGKTRQEIEDYMAPRALALSMRDYMVPNAFHRQRLGPGQNLQLKGHTLITGKYQPPAGVNPFLTQVEGALFRLLAETSHRDREGVREMRQMMQANWQFDFDELERVLRGQFRRFNLTLEYEIARRLADDDTFAGCCEAVLYDLKDRLSLCVGAWQAFYWNWELYNGLSSGRLGRQGNPAIPLPMSCEDSKRVYRRTAQGQQCLQEMAVTERKAAVAEPYVEAFIEDYWTRHAPSRQDHPDNAGLSLSLIREMFSSCRQIGSLDRPDSANLSAALVKRLFLVPRDRQTGQVKPYAPRRKAFVRAFDFQYDCEDGALNTRFSLRSGAYATTVAGLIADTSDPEELEQLSGNDGEAAEAKAS